MLLGILTAECRIEANPSDFGYWVQRQEIGSISESWLQTRGPTFYIANLEESEQLYVGVNRVIFAEMRYTRIHKLIGQSADLRTDRCNVWLESLR